MRIRNPFPRTRDWSRTGAILAMAGVFHCCAGTPDAGPSEGGPKDPMPMVHWERMDSSEFATFVRELQEPEWDPATHKALLEASEGFGETALRSTLLLARTTSPTISEHFLQHLEERVAPPSRGEGGNQITQAAALLLRPTPLTPNQRERLLALAIGPAPHPNLAVRVECARTLLALDEARTIPFLIRVLRARTPAERNDPPDWPRIDTLAWVKHRSSRALAEHFQVPDVFRPDGSWQHQMDEAAAYEKLAQGAASLDKH